MTENLLQLENLTVGFPIETPAGNSWAYAVNNLNLALRGKSVLGLVGESGCGKSLSSLAILRLIPQPGKIISGKILFQGQDLLALSEAEMRKHRGAEIALIPQDPLTSLNPVYTIGAQIAEVLTLHQGLNKDEARRKTVELLDLVRLPNAKERINDYPHQFSGGMRQRVMIAMALSCSPSLLIADEPTTALDVTVQAQILQLMRDIQQEKGMSILMITHDLGVVAEMCDEVAVMYAGRIVEQAGVVDLFKHPKHPYTQGLLNSLPTLEKTGDKTGASTGKKRLEPIEGHPPSVVAIPPGCPFEPRCKERMDVCTTVFPETTRINASHIDAGGTLPHDVRCYLYS